MAGIVGHRQYSFDLWGDTVNTADRVQRHGRPGAVNLSGRSWELVKAQFQGDSLGEVAAKGKDALQIFAITGGAAHNGG